MTKPDFNYKDWEYEFKEWRKNPDFNPIHIEASADVSPSYEMNKATLFRLEGGRYALVYESGCSCYEPSSAEIEYFPNKRAVITWLKLNHGKKQPEYSDDARHTLYLNLVGTED